MPQMEVFHEIDPKQKILDQVGDRMSRLQITANNVIVAVYQRPTTMMLGGKAFDVPQSVVDEDQYQSKVGLILKAGPDAFTDERWFSGADFEIGDWVMVHPSAVQSAMFGGVLCRVVQDTAIKIKIEHPDDAY